MGKSRAFYHWGDFGDIVYALPIVRALEGGEMVLALDDVRYAAMEPLVAAQPYVTGCRQDSKGSLGNWAWKPPGITHDLNLFRTPEFGTLRWKTLVEMQSWPFAVNVSTKPWLTVPGQQGRYKRALVARSARYHREDADWKSELEALRWRHSEVLFVGTSREHQEFGHGLERLETPTLLDLGVAIWESQYFAGNQSMPLSVAIGLGVPHSIEIDPTVPNCTFTDRPEQRQLADFRHTPSMEYSPGACSSGGR